MQIGKTWPYSAVFYYSLAVKFDETNNKQIRTAGRHTQKLFGQIADEFIFFPLKMVFLKGTLNFVKWQKGKELKKYV